MIRVDNFTKTYNDFVAVRDLTFSVAPGEILSLIHISEPTRQLMSSRMPSSA